MPFRFLGNSGLKVSALSYGTWITGDHPILPPPTYLSFSTDTHRYVLHAVHGQIGLETTKACMKEAWDHGCNYFDTAEVYQAGECEKIVGQALQELEWVRSDYVCVALPLPCLASQCKEGDKVS